MPSRDDPGGLGISRLRPVHPPASRLGEEHTTWRGDRFHDGEAVFLEIAAACRKYQAPLERLVYVGAAPEGAGASADLAPGSVLVLEPGMIFHAHSWFANTQVVDYFISNTVLLTEADCEVRTSATPETLICR